MRERGGGGFTLFEMAVTLLILAILLTLSLPSARYRIQREKEAELRLALMQIRNGIDDYKHASSVGLVAQNTNGYPVQLTDLVRGVPDLAAADHHKLFFLRSMPADPFYDSTANGPASDPADTWGLRSYSSSADAPAPGADVFDVYSRSTQVGLNGIAYNKW